MSRTKKDRPWRVVRRELHDRHCGQDKCLKRPYACSHIPAYWHTFPPPHGGSWNGIGKYTTAWWRSHRHAAKIALAQGIEPEPPIHKHGAKWDVY
jgi:hypothetical protein